MTDRQLDEVQGYVLQTAEARRNSGAMAGSLKKDGTPNQALKNSESEFFMGAYTCLVKMMSLLDETTLDKAMKYFSPLVMFSIMRNDSIVDEFNTMKEKGSNDDD